MQQLTTKLDDLDDVSLTPELLNEIVLSKVNRYVALDRDQLQRIDALRKLKLGEHRQARSVLEELLDAHGVDLLMASTILRFRKQHRRRLSGKTLLPSCRTVGSTPEVWRIAAPSRKFTTILELRLKATSVCAKNHRRRQPVRSLLPT